jgi:carboxymethylenebutenolidase
MFRIVPAPRAVRSARLAGLAVVGILFSAGLAYVLHRADGPMTDTIVAAKPSAGPAGEPPRDDRPATDGIGPDTRAPGPVAQAAGKEDALIWTKDCFDSAGKKISVRRYGPAGGGKHPAVVMLGGQDGWGQIVAYEFATRDLVEKGFVVLLIRYYDRTDTPERVPVQLQAAFEKWLKEGAPEGVKNDARDHFEEWIATVADAVAYARKLPNVDANRVGIVGFSLGGYLALSAAPRCNPPVGAVVEMLGGIPKEKRENLGKLPPTLIVHGNKDRVVPVDEAYLAFGLLRERKQAVEIRIIENADHGFCFPGTDKPNPLKLYEARKEMTKYFVAHLRYAEIGNRIWAYWRMLSTFAAEGANHPLHLILLHPVLAGLPSYRLK